MEQEEMRAERREGREGREGREVPHRTWGPGDEGRRLVERLVERFKVRYLFILFATIVDVTPR